MLITIIAAFCFAYYAVNVVNPAMRIKRAFKINPLQRLKPLDCTQCLTVWIAVVLYLLPAIYSEALAIIFGAGFISIKIK